MEVPMRSKLGNTSKNKLHQLPPAISRERRVTVHVDVAACIRWSLIGLATALAAFFSGYTRCNEQRAAEGTAITAAAPSPVSNLHPLD